jgi:hypothetical protein
MHAERAMPLFRYAIGQRENEAECEYTESSHAD